MRPAIVSAWILAGICAAASAASASEDLSGLKALVVVPPADFRDEEFLETKKALDQEKIGFAIVSAAAAPVKGMLGLEIRADIALKDAVHAIETCAAVIFIGGAGATAYFEDEAALAFARTAARQRKLVAAICLAPAILAKAGLLKGRKATVWKSEARTLEKSGAQYVATDSVVVDGRYVTANGPGAAKAFGLAVVKWLSDRESSVKRAEEAVKEAKALREKGEHEKARALLTGTYEANKADMYVGSQALFEIGFTFFTEKKNEEAAEAFTKVCTEYPQSDFFGMAQFNAALITHRHFRKPREAIAEYEKLIAGDCNDWDGTGDIMTPYRNYRHKAIMAIGRIRMELGEHAAALQAFLDAFHKDYYVSHCGTCLEGANRERAEWASKAASALAGLPPDGTQGEVMKKAPAADAYLLLLGKAYLAAGDDPKAEKAFDALKSAFPASPLCGEIPSKR